MDSAHIGRGVTGESEQTRILLLPAANVFVQKMRTFKLFLLWHQTLQLNRKEMPKA